jgi:TRAP-type C4-dicarboxylate transport system substrate-binding protein
METTRTRTGMLIVAFLTLAAFVAAGCFGGGNGADKAGGTETHVTLRFGTPDAAGLPGSEAMNEFARRVDELSGGSIQVDPVFEAFEGQNPIRLDQSVAKRVESGDLDLGLIPARAFDALGVTSLQALQAPFLIDSDPLVNKVVTDPLAQKMLAGLDEAGLHGLSLWPEGLRRPIGFEKPFLTLADFAGAKVRSPYSRASYSLLRALGAEPADISGPGLTNGIVTGAVPGVESELQLSQTLPKPGIATSNVVFFPKVNTLVINEETLNGLSDDQANTLREAAADTQRWAIEHNPSEAAAARQYCEKDGGAVVPASPDDLAKIVAATAPVYDRLDGDPETKALIERIRTLKRTLATQASTPPPCGHLASHGATAGEPAATQPSGPAHPAIPDGVYRTKFTAEEFLDAGVEESFAHENAGIWTLTFRHGHFSQGGTDEEGHKVPECQGDSRVGGGRVAISWSPATQCTGDITAKLTVDPNGDLRFTDVHTADLGDRVVWGIHTWVKIG